MTAGMWSVFLLWFPSTSGLGQQVFDLWCCLCFVHVMVSSTYKQVLFVCSDTGRTLELWSNSCKGQLCFLTALLLTVRVFSHFLQGFTIWKSNLNFLVCTAGLSRSLWRRLPNKLCGCEGKFGGPFPLVISCRLLPVLALNTLFCHMAVLCWLLKSQIEIIAQHQKRWTRKHRMGFQGESAVSLKIPQTEVSLAYSVIKLCNCRHLQMSVEFWRMSHWIWKKAVNSYERLNIHSRRRSNYSNCSVARFAW